MRGEGVRCPLCNRQVVTTEAPCECGFRFPRGYGELARAKTDLAFALAQGDAAAEDAAAARIAALEAEADRPARAAGQVEPREGMVTVYDSDGRYVGCMGVETWQGLLAAGASHSQARPEKPPATTTAVDSEGEA